MNYRNNTLRNVYAWKQEVYYRLTRSDDFFPDELDQLLRQSFAAEEFLMICSGYHDYEHQCAAHRCCLDGLQNRWAEPESWCHLQTFLHHWMRQHDILYDRYFQEYFALWEEQKCRTGWEQWNPEYVILNAKTGRLG